MKNKMGKQTIAPVVTPRETTLSPDGFISHGFVAAGDTVITEEQVVALKDAKPEDRHDILKSLK